MIPTSRKVRVTMDKRKLKFSKAMLMSAFIHNPVLTQSIGICTIVAIGTTLKISMVFSLLLSVLLIILELLSSLVLKKLTRWIRISVYMLISTMLLIPVMLYMDKNYSEMSANMGIYLPLLSVNALPVIRCEAFAVKNNLRNSLFDAVAASVGFTAVALIVGIVRELMAYGSVFGKTVSKLPTVSGIALPFGGLIVIGFLSAIHKWIVMKKFPRYPTNTFNLRTAFDKPTFKNDGIFIKKTDKASDESTQSDIPDNTDDIIAVLFSDSSDEDDEDNEIIFSLSDNNENNKETAEPDSDKSELSDTAETADEQNNEEEDKQ